MNRDILRILENAGECMPPGYKRERNHSLSMNQHMQFLPLGAYGKMAFSSSPHKHNRIISYGYTI